MNIYLISTIGRVGGEECSGAVIVAKDKKQAKEIADSVYVVKPYRVNLLGEGRGFARLVLSEHEPR